MSFFSDRLQQAYSYDHSAILGTAITSYNNDMVAQMQSMHVTVVGIRYDVLTQEISDFCHAAGLKICAWTVNDTKTIQKMYDLDADYVMSDYPDRIVSVTQGS